MPNLQSFKETEQKHWREKFSKFYLSYGHGGSGNAGEVECEEMLTLFKESQDRLEKAIREDERERVVEMVERRKKYTNWSHTIGSHSDDRGDNEPCDCRDVEMKWKSQTFDEIIKDDILSSLKGEH